MPFLAFLWLTGVGKTNIMSGNRTVPPFLVSIAAISGWEMALTGSEF